MSTPPYTGYQNTFGKLPTLYKYNLQIIVILIHNYRQLHFIIFKGGINDLRNHLLLYNFLSFKHKSMKKFISKSEIVGDYYICKSLNIRHTNTSEQMFIDNLKATERNSSLISGYLQKCSLFCRS